jgi:hypothetical protein
VPDAEVHWPPVPASLYPDECWAIDAELTPKGTVRTAAIMTGLLTQTTPAAQGRAPRYDHVVYLCSPAALPTVRGGAATIPASLAVRLDVRDLPEGAAPVIFFYAQLLLARHALQWVSRLIKWTVTAAVLVMAAPVTVVTAAAVTLAWLRGWPPARLRRAAAWSAPMTAAWLTVQVITTRSLSAVLAAPYSGWRAAWHAFSLGAGPGWISRRHATSATSAWQRVDGEPRTARSSRCSWGC